MFKIILSPFCATASANSINVKPVVLDIVVFGLNTSLYGIPGFTLEVPVLSIEPNTTALSLGVVKFVISFPASNTTSSSSNLLTSYLILYWAPARLVSSSFILQV